MSKTQVKTRAFKKTEVRKLETYMKGLGTPTAKRDLAIFRTGIDSLLRVGDLLALKTDTLVASNGELRKSFQVVQKKTGKPVQIQLGERTIKALEEFLESKDESTEYLFTGRQSRKTEKPVTDVLWRKRLKQYCEELGIDNKEISTHSTRKTVPTLLGNQGNIKAAQLLLNHKS